MGVCGLWLSVLLFWNWTVTKVMIYSEGPLLNGQPRLWGTDLEHVLFDEVFGEFRFYKDYETDDTDDRGAYYKSIDVFRLPIAERQRRRGGMCVRVN